MPAETAEAKPAEANPAKDEAAKDDPAKDEGTAAAQAPAGEGAEPEDVPRVAEDPTPTLTAFAAKIQLPGEPTLKIEPAPPAGAHARRGDPVSEADDTGAEVASALRRLRSAIVGSAYPLVLPSAEDARRVSAALIAQLDDYLLPRLSRLDAPLLVVVGGSTGAGKSTLVNSFVRAPVSPAGVLRPTTRTPVLVCNPADAQWFRRSELLPGLTRTTEATADPNALQIVAAPALAPGLAYLDAPDIDSVVDANRALAAQLLAAADLWLFVTTAARYADAVPWELLQTARYRGTVTALALDRVPPEATDEVTAHLLEMLSIHGLHNAPLFVLPETEIDRQGLLPETVTAPLREWFERIATDAATRAAVVRQTLDGALAALGPAVEALAAAADEQVTTADALDDRVRAAYRTGRRTVSQGVQDGRLLRGEVLARWQEFIGTGELLRTLEARVGRLRDRVVAALTGRPQPGRELKSAIEANLVTLIRGAAADAAESAYTGWQAHPAGTALLEPSLGRNSPDLPERAERLVRDWQRGVLELIRKEAGHKRATARGAAYAVNATGLLVMVGVFASTAFIPTGAEVAVAGGTTVAAQKVLEAIFGDQAIRALATKAREDLISRTNALLDAEANRYTDRLIAAGISADPGKDLRDAAALVEYTRAKAELTSGTGLTLPGVDA
nr:ABC transporter [Phytohabitans suffuscus]